MKRIAILFTALFLFAAAPPASAQDRLERIRHSLDSLALEDDRYDTPVDVSVANFSVAELIRSLAIGNGLNVNIDLDRSKAVITCNLEHVPVKDVFYLFCKEKDLNAEVLSGILTFTNHVTEEEAPEVLIDCDKESGLVSFDFTGCPLSEVARKFNEATGDNLLFPYSLAEKKISGYGRSMTMEDAVRTIAAVNDLQSKLEKEGTWTVFDVGKDRERSGLFVGPGTPDSSSIFCVRVFEMKYRTIVSISDIIPADLKQGVGIMEFPDLNALVLSGSLPAVSRLKDFLCEIDRSVPLISIDVIIVDATDQASQTMGVSLGKGTKPAGEWKGTFSPGVDLSLDAARINQLIGSFNGLGLFNLGNVGANFYADLKFLEDAGKIVLRSTPKLATLNGHKAILKSGEVKYYKESHVNIIGTQNPLQSESYLWKDVEANFVLDLLPFVSADSTITVAVNLSQDEFTTRDTDDMTAPPGLTKRSFNSTVRVKDGDMVLLGGIEKNLTQNSSRGLPFIARIPVLRLLFGNVSKKKDTQKLSVFIRPKVVE